MDPDQIILDDEPDQEEEVEFNQHEEDLCSPFVSDGLESFFCPFQRNKGVIVKG